MLLNTLGVVQYRNGLYQDAVGTLEKSLLATAGLYDGYDLIVLAMSHAKLGDHAKCKERFDAAVKWAEKATTLTAKDQSEFADFRKEAETLFSQSPSK